MAAYLTAMVGWVRENKVACTPAEFCRQAGISKGTLRRHPKVASLVNEHGWRTAPGLMRPSPSTVASPAHGETKAARHAAERDRAALLRLRDQVEEARRTNEASDRRTAALLVRVKSLENLVDVLVHRLVRRDRALGPEVEALVREVIDQRDESDAKVTPGMASDHQNEKGALTTSDDRSLARKFDCPIDVPHHPVERRSASSDTPRPTAGGALPAVGRGA